MTLTDTLNDIHAAPTHLRKLHPTGVNYTTKTTPATTTQILNLSYTGTGIDFFISHPPHQPKQAIGEYVAQNGIRVPRIFGNLPHAITYQEKHPVIARSEHSDEYAWASGILNSVPLSKIIQALGQNSRMHPSIYNAHIQTADVQSWQFLRELDQKSVIQYCHYLDIDPEAFLTRASYSYWEYIPGYNQTIIADNAIPNRYHIMVQDPRHNRNAAYLLWDNETITTSTGNALPEVVYTSLQQVIETYTYIRNLPKFDAMHCPIMEFQTSYEGQVYFLQYHRSRSDTCYSDFRLYEPPTKNSYRVPWVRWATKPGGIILDTTIVHSEIAAWMSDEEGRVPSFPKAKNDAVILAAVDSNHLHTLANSLASSHRYVQLFDAPTDFALHNGACNSHWARSGFLVPPLSMIVSTAELLGKQTCDTIRERAAEQGQSQSVLLHYVSDGETAYITPA